jgi:hypothetical protein
MASALAAAVVARPVASLDGRVLFVSALSVGIAMVAAGVARGLTQGSLVVNARASSKAAPT